MLTQLIIHTVIYFITFLILIHHISEAKNCTNDLDCFNIVNSFCNLNTNNCTCPRGQYISSNLGQCIQISHGYGSPCTDSVQCSEWMKNGAECSSESHTCRCVDGFHYRNGECFRTSKYKEPCLVNENCFDGYDLESLQCVSSSNLTSSSICQCSSNYFNRYDIDCRRNSHLNEPCLINVECLSVHGKCNKNSFKCKKRFVNDYFEPMIDFKYINADNFPIISKAERVIGSNCTNNYNCSKIMNTFCYLDGTCHCLKGFATLIEQDLCIPELGTPTNNSTECNYLRNSEYRNGACLCRIGFASTPNNRECIKGTRDITFSCTTDINCHSFGPYSICLNKQCVCSEFSWYKNSSMLCQKYKKIGDDCSENRDCYIDSHLSLVTPICGKNQRCQCPNSSHPALDSRVCQADHVDIGGHCYEKTDCVQANTNCVNNTCICDQFYFEDTTENICRPGIGGYCNTSADCLLENSFCSETKNVCQCDANYVNSNNCCYKIVFTFNDTCVVNEQCTVSFNNGSICHNNQCICQENYHFRHGKCYPIKYVNEACSSDGECYTDTNQDSIECRNGQCLCSFGYLENLDQKQCVTGSASRIVFNYLLNFTYLIIFVIILKI